MRIIHMMKINLIEIVNDALKFWINCIRKVKLVLSQQNNRLIHFRVKYVITLFCYTVFKNKQFLFQTATFVCLILYYWILLRLMRVIHFQLHALRHYPDKHRSVIDSVNSNTTRDLSHTALHLARQLFIEEVPVSERWGDEAQRQLITKKVHDQMMRLEKWFAPYTPGNLLQIGGVWFLIEWRGRGEMSGGGTRVLALLALRELLTVVCAGSSSTAMVRGNEE